MRLIRVGDYREMSAAAADIVSGCIEACPDAVLVPATGNTPVGLYEELASRHARGLVDSSTLRVFQLDEYLGVARDDPRSLYAWMERAFLRPLDIAEGRVVRLDGTATDLSAACRRYDAALSSAGGIELAILGLGENGHLGYNEPPSDAEAPTRVVTLTERSRRAASQYFGSPSVPDRALTAGMAPLLASRQILLLVSGAHKRAILHRVLEEPPTPMVPASWLQALDTATIVADAEALGQAG